MKKLLLTICIILFTTISYAEEESKKYNLMMMTYPMMCGMPEEVNRYIMDHKFTAINVSFGKEGATEDGDVIFAITYYINDKHETLAVAEAPNDPFKCIVFQTFDMQMNTNLLPGTDT